MEGTEFLPLAFPYVSSFIKKGLGFPLYCIAAVPLAKLKAIKFKLSRSSTCMKL